MFRTALDGQHRYYMVAISDEVEAKAAMTEFLYDDIPGLECRALPAAVLMFVGLTQGEIREWVLG